MAGTASGGRATPRGRRIGAAVLAVVTGCTGLVALGVVGSPPAGAALGLVSTVRISETRGNTSDPGKQSNEPAISPDGLHVAFSSDDPDIVAGDTNNAADVFVRDGDAAPVRVSLTGAGQEWMGRTNTPSISADGRYVAFVSNDGMLDGVTTATAYDVYVHDRDVDGNGVFDEAGQTALALVSKAAQLGGVAGNVGGNGNSLDPYLTPDGRYVAFRSSATNLATVSGPGARAFVHDRDADGNGVYDEPGGVTTSLVDTSTSFQRTLIQGRPRLTEDGSTVLVISALPLDPVSDTNAANDAYLLTRGAGGWGNAGRQLVSVDGAGQPTAVMNYADISGNGRYIVWDTNLQIPGFPGLDGQDHIFRRDRDPDGDGTLDNSGLSAPTRIDLLPSVSTPFDSIGAAVNDSGAAAFLSDVGPAGANQVFVQRPIDPVATLVSTSTSANYGTPGEAQVLPVIADDVTAVAYSADFTDVVAGDGNNHSDVFLATLAPQLSAVHVSLFTTQSTTTPIPDVPINAIPTERLRTLAFDVATAPGGTRLRPGGTRLRPGGTRLRPGGTRLRPGGTRLRDVAQTSLQDLAASLADAPTARTAPLSQIEAITPGGWPALLAGTPLADRPIQSVSIGDLLDVLGSGPVPPALAALTIDDLVLDASPLVAISPAGFDLGRVPLRQLQYDPASSWCDAVAAKTDTTCADLGVPVGSTRSLLELDLDPDAALVLSEHPELRRPQLAPNRALLASNAAPISRARLDDLNLQVTNLGTIRVQNAVSAPAVAAIPLTALTPGELAKVAVCTTTGFTCASATLGGAAAAGALRPTATLADVGKHFGGLTVTDLPADLLGSITVNDVVTGYLDAADFPWEDLDLQTSGVQEFASTPPTISYTVFLSVDAAGDGEQFTIDADLALPAGFRLDRDRVGQSEPPVAFDAATGSAQRVSVLGTEYSSGGGTVHLRLVGAGASTQYPVRVRVVPGFQLGTGNVSAVARAGALQGASNAAPITVTRPARPAGATVPQVSSDRLYFGYLTGRADVDRYQYTPSTPEAQVGVRLSHLAGDADLVLYGPPTDAAGSGPSALASRVNGPQVPPADAPALDPSQNQVTVSDTASADVPSTPPTGQVEVARSASRDVVDVEGADAVGASTIQVSSYDGATSSLPYVLRVRDSSPRPDPACQAPADPYVGTRGTLPDLTALAANLRTVVLVDEQRMRDLYPGADVDAMLAKLQSLVADPEVKGVVLPVDGSSPSLPGLTGYPDVAGAISTWKSAPCSVDAANAVVDRVTALVDGIRRGTLPGVAAHPQLANVVVVGNDSALPMGRIADTTRAGNENQYADQLPDGSPLQLALATGHYLSDDPYGDFDPIPWLNRRLYVADVAVGRLVETPQEIGSTVDQYLAPGTAGILDPSTSLVSGYDWMKTGADSVRAKLGSKLTVANGGNPVTPSNLVNDSWTPADLAGAISGAGSKVISLFLHSDHRFAEAAAPNPGGDAFLDSEELAAALPSGSKLVFSMGCHAGLNEPDLGASAPDFPQNVSGDANAVFVASTGFGYGSAVGVAMHDRLMGFFADQLDGAVTVGQALSAAKQQYFATEGLYGAYDDKVISSMVMYGLPMYRVGNAGTTRPTVPDVVPGAPSNGVSQASFAYDTTDAGSAAVPMTGALGAHTSTIGSWYEVSGYQPLAVAGRPLQPRVDADVTASDNGVLRPAHGALVTALAGQQTIGNFDAAWTSAAIDAGAAAPELAAGDVAFPSRLATITTATDPAGAFAGSGLRQRQRVVVVPGRFESDASRNPDGRGVEELFGHVGGQILYSTSEDYTEPVISSTAATVNGATGRVHLSATVSDDSGIRRVVAMFRDDTGWHAADLTGGSGTWSADVDASSANDTVPYFVQAVDGAGNVGVASNKGALFDAAIRPDIGIGDVTVDEPATGTAAVTFTVTLSEATTVPVQVEWSTRDGGAAAPADYAADANTLLFEPGQTSRSVTVRVNADQVAEGNESFFVELANATRARLARATASATIVETGAPAPNPTLVVSPTNAAEGSAATFTVTLSQPPAGSVSVQYATQAASATAGIDFTPVSGTLLFSPGQTSTTVAVATLTDSVVEPDEVFGLALSNATPGVDVVGATGVGSIFDVPPPAVSPQLPQPQAISWTAAPPATAAIAHPFPVAATASSGLPVQLAVSGPCSLAAGVVTGTGVGSCQVTANQSGDAGWEAAPQQTSTVAVGVITVTTAPSPSVVGQPVALTANVGVAGVSAAALKGTVKFLDGTTVLGSKPVANGSATLTSSALKVGSRSITAKFTRSGSTTVFTSPAVTQVVGPATTTLALTTSLSPTRIGQSVTFTATATRVAPATGKAVGGTVTFFDNGVAQATKSLGAGGAKFATTKLTVGAHVITATYNGSSTDLGSTAPGLAQQVAPAVTTTVVTSSQSTAVHGASVTLKAAVKRVLPAKGTVVTGTVQFFDNGLPLGAPVAVKGGIASLATRTLAVGGHLVTATYSGSSTDLGSTTAAAFVQTVT